MKLVDSHCHLDAPKFAEDREETIARARAAGVEMFLAIGSGDGPPDLEAGVRIAENREGFYATAGVHPHDASKSVDGTMEKLREAARNPKVVAIGEIGLDYHYDFSPREVQMRVFVEQLAVAREADLPVVIHTREAWADTMRVLREEWAGRPGIMHCFTGGPAEAMEALEVGFHISFGGVITFPKSEANREAARLTPEDRLLVETDAPFLAPAPYRGKRNEPAFIVETVKKLAEIRGVEAELIARVTVDNFQRLCLRPAVHMGRSDE